MVAAEGLQLGTGSVQVFITEAVEGIVATDLVLFL